MAKLSSIKTDTVKSENGVWVDYESGIRLKIARIGNPAFQSFVSSRQKNKIRGIRSGSISSQEAEQITKEAVARHILLDWQNVEDEDGLPLRYSPEKSLEILSDPQLSDLYSFVLVTSNNSEIYRLEAQEEAKGN